VNNAFVEADAIYAEMDNIHENMNNLQNELFEAYNISQFTKIAELLEEANTTLNEGYA
jgi:hypothetical protein